MYNNPSQEKYGLLRSSDYEVIEMIKSHQSLWKNYRIGLYMDAAYYTSLTYNHSILSTCQIVFFCKVLCCFFSFYMNVILTLSTWIYKRKTNTTNSTDMCRTAGKTK